MAVLIPGKPWPEATTSFSSGEGQTVLLAWVKE